MTNGETTDYADARPGRSRSRPELGEGCDGCGFVFPDDEALVQAEFEKTLPFALAREVGAGPGRPGLLGIDGQAVLPRPGRRRPGERTRSPMFDFTFDVSYGDPQAVQVLGEAQPRRGDAQVPGQRRAVQSAPTSEWTRRRALRRRQRRYYHVMRGTVTGTKPGDTVEVWFEGGGETSESFTYTAVSETGDRVLVLAAEDYTGASPGHRTRRAALPVVLPGRARRERDRADVYDVDANGRTAPDALGVLSHYDAVVWYTGDDVVTRETGMGRRQRVAARERRAARGARLTSTRAAGVLYTGKYAGLPVQRGRRHAVLRPVENAAVRADPADPRRCRPLHGSGDGNDFLQYWLGAYLVNDGAGHRPRTGEPFDVARRRRPVRRAGVGLQRRRQRRATRTTARSFITTSGILPARRVPAVRELGRRRSTTGRAGRSTRTRATHYVYSQIARHLVQAADAHDRRPGGRRRPVVLDLVRHRGRLGPRLRRGAHRRPGRLDDAAGPERAHDPGHRATAARRAGATCTRTSTTTRR